MRDRFQRANTSHDGRLTLQQAQSAQMPNVARHFDAIDAGHKGYITMDDVRSWHQRNAARRAAQGNGGATSRPAPPEPAPPEPVPPESAPH